MSSFASLLANYASAKRGPAAAAGAGAGAAGTANNHDDDDHHHQPAYKRSKTEGPHFDAIQTLLQRNRASAPTPTATEPSTPFGGLGILIIIVDALPHEALWRLWLEHYTAKNASVEPPPVRIWVHAKFPDRVRSRWVRERLVQTFQLRPGWGSVELTEVMVRMLAEAVAAAPHLTKFCFASESCVPALPLSAALRAVAHHTSPGHVAPAAAGGGSGSGSGSGAPPAGGEGASEPLSDDGCSWVRWQYEATNGYAQQQQFDVLRRGMPADAVVKADQWVLLSRAHALAVLALPDRVLSVTPASSSSSTSSSYDHTQFGGKRGSDHNALLKALFRQVKASDEMYFPCCLAILGLIPPAGGDTASAQATTSSSGSSGSDGNVLRRQLTYCVWGQGDKSPETFPELTPALLAKAQGQGSVFLRKVAAPGSAAVADRSLRVWLKGALRVDDNDGAGPVDEEEEEGSGRAAWTTEWCVARAAAYAREH